MSAKDIVGNVATVVTIGSFFAGVPVCLKIRNNGSTEGLSPTPFIVGNLCNALWLRYGLYIGDSSLVCVNTVGFVLQMTYIVCFYLYTYNRSSFYKQITLYGVTLSSLTIYLLLNADNIELVTNMCGMMAAVGSVATCASTLSVLADVLRTKSTENMPFPIIVSSFVVCSLWFFYGVILWDKFIEVPNAIGATISGLQLCLFVIYPSNRPHAE